MRVTLQIHQARQRHGLDPVSFFFQCLVLVCFDRHLGGVCQLYLGMSYHQLRLAQQRVQNEAFFFGHSHSTRNA